MLRKLALIALIPVIGAFIFFITIDRRVGRRLEARGNGRVSAILSAPFRVRARVGTNLAILRHELEVRRYAEETGPVLDEGEFKLTDASLAMTTRPFLGPDGKLFPSRKISFDLKKGTIKETGSNDPVESFLLEPMAFSNFGSGDRRVGRDRKLDDIPKYIQDAVVAIEDERFYRHHGIDIVGILRAIAENVRAMRLVQGGSTLTQQLAKNMLLTPERSLSRKFQEVFAALSLERRLSKQEILELYLNEIYLGQEGSVAIHGVAEAAYTFFGKELSELSIDEAALLAGIIKAPSYFSPRKHADRATERRNLVLSKMRELGYITPADYEKASASPLTILPNPVHEKQAEYYVAALEQSITKDYGFDPALLVSTSVYTGLHPDLQNCAEKAVAGVIAELDKRSGKKSKGSPLQASLVAIEPYSGLVRAWVGGRNFGQNQFNRVSQGVRQIGSIVKPFLYLTALDQRLNTYKVANPLSVLVDEPQKVEMRGRMDWTPENYDHSYHGDVSLRYALERSLNMPAVYVAQRVGIENVAKTLKDFNVAESVEAVPALALGAADTTLLRLTAAYGALANGGLYVEPRLFVSALDTTGEVIAKTAINEQRVADEPPVFVLTHMLRGVLDHGTARVVRSRGFTGMAAGKTGTSNDSRDAWFVGFTPNLVTGVWVGYDDNRKTGLTGGVAAAPIWGEFMKCGMGYVEQLSFIPPPGVTMLRVDPTSRKRASPNCPKNLVYEEAFVEGTEPREVCTAHDPSLLPSREDLPDVEGIWDRIFGE